MEKERFLLNSRKSSIHHMAFSIASSWIWAPALIISAQKGFTHGLFGTLSFLIPNFITLIIFGILINKITQKSSSEFTFTKIILEHYKSRRLYYIYLFQHITLQVCCLAVQILAASKILNTYFHLSFLETSFVLTLISMSYIYIFGLYASIISDYLKLIFLILLLIIICPLIIYKNYSQMNFSIFFWGMTNKSHQFLDKSNLRLLLDFTIPATIGLISGPFGDQAFYQRAFAINKKDVIKSFLIASLIFAIVPLSNSILGMSYASLNTTGINSELPNFELITNYFPNIVFKIFIFAFIMALISAMDSHFSALSCFGGHDLNEFLSGKKESAVKLSRLLIIAGGLLAIIIANIPNIQITHLFLFYGTFRSCTFIITIFLMNGKTLEEKSVFWGLLITFLIGVPLLIWANFIGNSHYLSFISIGMMLSPFFITKLSTRRHI